MLDKLRTIAEGPALDLPPVAWEPPNHIGRRAVAEWDDPALGGPSVHLTPTGTSCFPYPLIDLGDERLSVDQAEVAARHLLAAVAMAREVNGKHCPDCDTRTADLDTMVAHQKDAHGRVHELTAWQAVSQAAKEAQR